MNFKNSNLPRTALILAGGVGSRMGSGWHGVPKCLISVGGSPLIVQILRRLGREGFERAVISTRPEFAQLIEKATRDYEGIDIHIISNHGHATSLIDAFCAVPQYIHIGEPFLLLLGDIYCAKFASIGAASAFGDVLYGQPLTHNRVEDTPVQGLIEYDRTSLFATRIEKFGIPYGERCFMRWSGTAYCGDLFWKDILEFSSMARDVRLLNLEELFRYRLQRGRAIIVRETGNFVNINTTENLLMAQEQADEYCTV